VIFISSFRIEHLQFCILWPFGLFSRQVWRNSYHQVSHQQVSVVDDWNHDTDFSLENWKYKLNISLCFSNSTVLYLFFDFRYFGRRLFLFWWWCLLRQITNEGGVKKSILYMYIYVYIHIYVCMYKDATKVNIWISIFVPEYLYSNQNIYPDGRIKTHKL
jgi:hypothetical protein